MLPKSVSKQPSPCMPKEVPPFSMKFFAKKSNPPATPKPDTEAVPKPKTRPDPPATPKPDTDAFPQPKTLPAVLRPGTSKKTVYMMRVTVQPVLPDSVICRAKLEAL